MESPDARESGLRRLRCPPHGKRPPVSACLRIAALASRHESALKRNEKKDIHNTKKRHPF